MALCQRYFTYGLQSEYFCVMPFWRPPTPSPIPGYIQAACSLSQEKQIWAYIEEQLKRDQVKQEGVNSTVHDDARKAD